jgi:hypothetical protein
VEPIDNREETTMFRKFTLAALLAAGTLGMTAIPASAQTPALFERHDHDRDHDHDRGRFQVLVRHRGHWDLQGTYRDRDDAQRAARRLERQGFDTRIERVRGW